MTLITFADGKVKGRVIRDCGVELGLFIGTEQGCCADCEPCCLCTDLAPSEFCALQSIVLEFTFIKLGTCFPSGGVATVTITEADEDLFFPWSKRVSVAADVGSIIIEANLWCLPDCCRAIQFSVIPEAQSCEFCSENTGISVPNFKTNGVNNGSEDCCPSGSEYELLSPIPTCDDDSGLTVSATFVY